MVRMEGGKKEKKGGGRSLINDASDEYGLKVDMVSLPPPSTSGEEYLVGWLLDDGGRGREREDKKGDLLRVRWSITDEIWTTTIVSGSSRKYHRAVFSKQVFLCLTQVLATGAAPSFGN